jgi:hypothetical protein
MPDDVLTATRGFVGFGVGCRKRMWARWRKVKIPRNVHASKSSDDTNHVPEYEEPLAWASVSG